MDLAESDAHLACFWLLAGIQFLGLLGMLAAPLLGNSAGQWLCLSGIVLVGCASIVAVWCGSGLWALSGTTLALIAIGATWERPAPGSY